MGKALRLHSGMPRMAAFRSGSGFRVGPKPDVERTSSPHASPGSRLGSGGEEVGSPSANDAADIDACRFRGRDAVAPRDAVLMAARHRAAGHCIKKSHLAFVVNRPKRDMTNDPGTSPRDRVHGSALRDGALLSQRHRSRGHAPRGGLGRVCSRCVRSGAARGAIKSRKPLTQAGLFRRRCCRGASRPSETRSCSGRTGEIHGALRHMRLQRS